MNGRDLGANVNVKKPHVIHTMIDCWLQNMHVPREWLGGPQNLKKLRHDILSHFFDGLNYG